MFTVSCKPENELILERGNYFYEQKDFHEAANQYNKIILDAISKKSLDEKETAILAHAHQQKSLCYAQLAESVNDIDIKKMYYQDFTLKITFLSTTTSRALNRVFHDVPATYHECYTSSCM